MTIVENPDQHTAIRCTVAGVRLTLSRSGVERALSSHLPDDVHRYWVEACGARWPVKQAFSLASGLPHDVFTSQTARRHLGRLGFSIGCGTLALSGPPRPAKTPSASEPTPVHPPTVAGHADVVLVGCVKSKRASGAPAKDLYTSAYFVKMRRYAEASGKPWFILSAQHGLVSPDRWLEPYDCYLPQTSREYRRGWGCQVADQLEAALGGLDGLSVEIHAGSCYVDAAAAPLRERGAVVKDPLRGLRQGERLAWYTKPPTGQQTPDAPALPISGDCSVLAAAGDLIQQLTDETKTVSLHDFLAAGRAAANSPGMYSWWVDETGATELSAGLGHPIPPGIIYAGLAGATRTGGNASANTLWGRIATMHLGRNHRFSTLRYSLGAILTAERGAKTIDETALTTWMNAHLRINHVPVRDRDRLDALESTVLRDLDPPLNLAKVRRTPQRDDLTKLRRSLG